LDHKKRYLQLAFNSTLTEAQQILLSIPLSDRIIYEAGTPLIKRYGMEAIAALRRIHYMRARTSTFTSSATIPNDPYIVADLKTFDRAETEVAMVAQAGASAAIALGAAPHETLDAFVTACTHYGLDSMVDMMNVEFPLSVLRAMKQPPHVVIIHRGVDEEHYTKGKQIALHEIRRVKGAYDILISIAGGDTSREVQSAVFNDADIVVVWKSVYQKSAHTSALIEGFLKEIK
jgi:bifunctional enzyme Fae/Hps